MIVLPLAAKQGELSCKGVKSSQGSLVKKSNFQTEIFAIIFVTINGHTSKLFKNTFNDVQAEGKGEMNTA